MSRLKLHFALAVSLLLHLAVLLWPAPQADAPARAAPPLQARVRAAPAVDAPADPAPPAPLLKDTRSENRSEAPEEPEPAPQASPPPRAARARAREHAQRVLNRHVFYPQDAIDRGLEGEVRLRLTLAADGRVLDAGILVSSGHALLDQAALDAARHIGRIDAAGARELMLPVLFRLD